MSKIKLISGKYGSRLIETPGNNITHPMGNRERQAIFNQIFKCLPGANVLDLFAGSGALGFEALSRDASHVDFVEKDQNAIKVIKTNAKSLQCGSQISIYRNIKQILTLANSPSYKLIFADPPYNHPQYNLIADAIELLEPSGVLVLSHPKIPQPPEFNSLKLISDRSYAAANIKIYLK